MHLDDKIYLLALSYVKGLGIKSLQGLMNHYNSAEEVWKLSVKDKNAIQGLNWEIANQIGSNKILQLAENEINFCQKHDIQVISIYEDEYPQLLKECNDAPFVVFFRGKSDMNAGKFLAIVGTRKMSSRAKDFIHEFVADLQNKPITIVSGLALGVDIEAHKAAIDNNLKTVGVLAHGLNQIFPKSNKKIGIKMMENGGLFSEFSTFHKPEPENFLRRNRIIAGLCEATIIIESAIMGGSMSTANHANNYNRDVFAVPGRVQDINSQGCHHLIKNHKAFLLTEADDVLKYLNISPKKIKKNVQKELFIAMSDSEQKLYDILKSHGKLHIDQLALRMGIATYQLMPILLDLEFKNIIEPLPGKYYDLN